MISLNPTFSSNCGRSSCSQATACTRQECSQKINNNILFKLLDLLLRSYYQGHEPKSGNKTIIVCIIQKAEYRPIRVFFNSIFGGAVASWLVRLSLDQAVWAQAQARDTVLCSWARHFTLTVPHLSTQSQEYKWVLANCSGNLTNCRGVTCDGLTFNLGRVEILLAASCYRTQDKLLQLLPSRL